MNLKEILHKPKIENMNSNNKTNTFQFIISYKFFIFSLFLVSFFMNAQIHFTSKKISLAKFETIKNFILDKGNTKTYRNFDNNNPHYEMDDYDIYLGSDIGQKNINNDPKKSDFNELIVVPKIKNYGTNLTFIAVRKGDLKSKKNWLTKTMKEGNVYVENQKNKTLQKIEDGVQTFLNNFYIEVIKTKISCSDLWEVYDVKPEQAIFFDCEKKEGQTVTVARYKVKGSNIDFVENLLIKKYNMGKIYYSRESDCSFYSPKEDKSGVIKNVKTKNIDHDFLIQIKMGTEECVFDEKKFITKSGKIMQLNELDYIWVTVTISLI